MAKKRGGVKERVKLDAERIRHKKMGREESNLTSSVPN